MNFWEGSSTWLLTSELREQGKIAFVTQDYEEAAQFFTSAASTLIALSSDFPDEDLCISSSPDPPRELLEPESCLVILYSNLSECFLRLHRFGDAQDAASKALAIDPAHFKSIRRLGLALEKQQQFVEARDCFERGRQWPNLPSPLLTVFERDIVRVDAQIERELKEKAEVLLHKAKGWGNKLLGKFGMSLDDFQIDRGEDGQMSISMASREPGM